MNDISPRELNRHLVCLNRRRSQFMAERLAGLGLAGSMYSILLCLGNRPGISQDFLVSYFSMDKGTVARLAKRLEEMGLITRLISRDDKRVYQLTLTSGGLDVLTTIREQLNQWSNHMLAGFNEEDRQTANRLLQRMTDNVTDHPRSSD
jgi:DNA-binding MarR family transcriptional regulator